MRRSRTRSLVTALLGALAAVAATGAWADGIDGYVEKMKKIEAEAKAKQRKPTEMDELMEKRFPVRVYRNFAGVFYHVNYKQLGDKDWLVPGPPHTAPKNFDQRGVQIRGEWHNGKKGVPKNQVTCVVVSFDDKKQIEFKALERAIDPKDVKALLQAHYDLYKRQLMPIPKLPEGADPKKPPKAHKTAVADAKKCKPPKKRKVGKVVRFAAAAQGAVKATKKRERREWYGWHSKKRGATFVVFVRVHPTGVDDRKAVKKGESFAKAIRE